MMTWLDALHAHGDEPAVLVTVAGAEGSVPREPGAKMLVTRELAFDTIGGGHLEQQACALARDMLAASALSRLARFALGPSLGQCCGGVVHLAFERIDAAGRAGLALLQARLLDRRDSWRIVALDAAPPVLADERGVALSGTLPFRLDEACRSRGCHVRMDDEGKRWLVDPCLAPRAHLLLFGAGHVGAALVRALDGLPCHVTWVDEREDMFPSAIPANVSVEATGVPEACVDAAPPGASFLVMTHSHALDQRLCEAILRRPDAGWCGLIGSQTKRRQFEHRLRARGIAAERLAAMACPVGLPGITGKQPAVIAASVCAQLLQVWEREAQARAGATMNTL